MSGNKEPLVSVLMNCYNSESFLKDAIDSVYAQSYKNFEILFIDNCSTDNSADIARGYDDKLKYYKTPQTMPLYAARAFAKQYISGDFLTFLDCDDMWVKDKLAHQLWLMESKDLDFLYTNADLIYHTTNPIRKLLSKTYLFLRFLAKSSRSSRFISRENFLKRYDIILQTVIIRTEKIKGLNFNKDLNLLGDLDFFLRLIWVNNIKLFYCNKKTVKYRIHEKQLTRSSVKLWLKEAKLLYEKSYFEILSPREQHWFYLAQVCLHEANLSFENGKTIQGLKQLWKNSSLSLQNKIHFFKMVVRVFTRKILCQGK